MMRKQQYKMSSNIIKHLNIRLMKMFWLLSEMWHWFFSLSSNETEKWWFDRQQILNQNSKFQSDCDFSTTIIKCWNQNSKKTDECCCSQTTKMLENSSLRSKYYFKTTKILESDSFKSECCFETTMTFNQTNAEQSAKHRKCSFNNNEISMLKETNQYFESINVIEMQKTMQQTLKQKKMSFWSAKQKLILKIVLKKQILLMMILF